MRVLSNSLKVLLAKQDITLIATVAIQYPTKTVRYTDAPTDLVISGQRFTNNFIVNVTPPQRYEGITRDLYEVTFAFNQELYDLVRSRPNGNPIDINVYVVNPQTFEVLSDNVFLIYGGYTSGFAHDDDTYNITIRSTGDLVKLSSVVSRSTSDANQNHFYDNDSFFDQVGQADDSISAKWGF